MLDVMFVDIFLNAAVKNFHFYNCWPPFIFVPSNCSGILIHAHLEPLDNFCVMEIGGRKFYVFLYRYS